ncbi:antA/AntB antirepressor family protein [Salipaludibacillus aurantiacus]|uniref:Anti-repressor protein n=1 Tax=Salipaludibacillus aurantiacus TaxID=1601833 RepID=A0A1H9U1W7_9BACI|nr:antA/AntB antirepressor family protein [Salipaludibacillus aurantiacus]SES03258.1 anti-repressor protein [Salipaludibacillus aurantiacus]
MTELIKTTESEKGEIIVSGRELHEFLEVRDRYTQWFSRMCEYGFTENVDFAVFPEIVQDSTAFGGKRKVIDHHIKLDAAKEIAMLQRTEKGKQARQYFIEVEKRWNNPEMIIKRAMDLQQKKIEALEAEKKENLPYTNFGKVVSNSDGAISVGAFSKMMYDDHGINLGRNKMFKWLRENGYLITKGREYNNPKQRFIDQGLFIITPTIVSRTQGDIETFTTLVTGKGQIKLGEKLIEEFCHQI